MFTLLFGFLSSLVLTILLVRYSHLHTGATGDTDLTGPQKIHSTIVPRIGGVSVYIGLIAASFTRYMQDSASGMYLGIGILVSTPVFGIGLSEDLTKKVSVKLRIGLVLVGALFASVSFGIRVTNLDIYFIEPLFLYPWFSVAFTCFAMIGLTNSYNIIDGFHGLSSFAGMLSLSAIAYVAFRVNDIEILIMCLAMIGPICGFFVWNYPRGLIFLGDGGAYLIGFWISITGILLVERNPQVSPWFVLLVNAYPIFETVFSVYRKLNQGKNPSVADGLHMHQLIYKRITSRPITSTIDSERIMKNQANAQTSKYLWIIALIAIIPALLFWEYSLVLQISFIAFCAIYIWLYYLIIKFKIPAWIK